MQFIERLQVICYADKRFFIYICIMRKKKIDAKQKPTEVLGLPTYLADWKEPPKNLSGEWSHTHELILWHVFQYVNQHKVFPSYGHIAKVTGINLALVRKHIKEYDANRVKDKYKIVADVVFSRLVSDFMQTGDIHRAEMILKYVTGLGEIGSNQANGVDWRAIKDRMNSSGDEVERTKHLITGLLSQSCGGSGS
jgi:hypothetical protein